MILQSFWNSFKIKLLSVIDKVVPYSTFVSQSIIQKVLNPWIKNKLNKRTRLLKLFNKTKTINLKTKIRSLDKEIRDFFRKQKRSLIRRSIVLSSSKSHCDAVKVAKNLNVDAIPEFMSLGNKDINKTHLLSEIVEL